MDNDLNLRNHVLALLQARGAHMDFDDAVADFPPELINAFPPQAPYTPWHLVEHIRISQWDILEYIRNPQHVSPSWPEGYWPDRSAQADAADWERSIQSFHSDLQAIQEMVADAKVDLFAPIPHGYGGHTILREALLVADHNAYHVGELAILRQVMGAWPKDRKA